MFRLALVFLFAASTLRAESPITITPNSGPTAGGTEVTMTGSFSGGPYSVGFGDYAAAASIRHVDEHTLVVVTPAHLPGRSTIQLFEHGVASGGGDTKVPFYFVGDPPPAFERILLPVFTPPVHGAFGSVFHMELRIGNHGSGKVTLYGLRPEACARFHCFLNPADEPVEFSGIIQFDPAAFLYNGGPGLFIYVPVDHVDSLAMNLRVYDVTRANLNFGTEMPILVQRDFVNGRIVLLGVPTDPRFRNTLRIYSGSPQTVTVAVGAHAPVSVVLNGATDLFDPAYGVFSDFPNTGAPVRVTIDAEQDDTPVSIPRSIWAFITVTNNETQVISTITPQP